MTTWSEIEKIQPTASRMITNSIKKGRISHAYLIQGERGTGKEAIATLIAKSIYCEQLTGVEPCQTCQMCMRIDSGNHPDVHRVEPDGHSIKIEQIKDLQKEFTYSSFESNQKVYIISGADTLTLNAANRILKFLEEPNQRTTAILLTENSQSIIPTIRSRCQLIDLKPLHSKHIREQLITLGMTERDAALMSALTNNIDEALEWSRDEWFADGRKLMIQLMEVLIAPSEEAYLFIHNHWLKHFKERTQLERSIDLLLLAFKDILYAHLDKGESMIVFDINDDRLKQLVLSYSQKDLIQVLHNLLDAKRHLKQHVNSTLVMEQLALQIQR